MKLHAKSIYYSLISVITIALLIVSPLLAQDTWNGDGLDDLTSNGDNWEDNGAPAVGTEGALTFGVDSDNYVVTVDAAYEAIGNVSFTGALTAYTIGETGAGDLGFGADSTITNPVAFTHVINSSMTSDGLTFDLANNLTVGGAIGGTTITKAGTATLTLSGDNGYTGVTNLNAGTIILGHNNALGVDAGAILTLGGDGTIQSNNDDRAVGNAIALGAHGLTVSGGSNLTLSGEISGTGTLTTSMTADDGTLTLSGTNLYEGGTTLTKGTIILGADAALGTGGLELGGDGTLQATAVAPTVTNAIDLATHTLTFSGANNATLSGAISSTGDGGILTKAGASILTLSGNNTYKGVTNLNAGTIILGHDNALGAGAGAILTLGGAGAIQASADGRDISNPIDNGGNALTVSGGNNLVLSGIMSGAGSLTVNMTDGADTLTLSGNNDCTGTTTLAKGTIILGHNNALGTGAGAILDLDAAATLQSNDALVVSNAIDNDTFLLTVSGASDLELSGVISDTGGLTKAGAGKLTLSGTNTYTGLTTLTAGTLNVTGTVAGALTLTAGTLQGTGTISGLATINGGTFTPGTSIGTTTFGGNYVQNGGTLEVEVSKAASGTLSSDFLDVGGSATLGAGSTIHVLDITPAGRLIGTGDTFNIIEADGGVTNNGPTITDNSAVLSFGGQVSGNFYQLVATRNAFATAVTGGNRRAVLGAIDSDLGDATGDYITLINALTALNSAQLNAAAQELDPLPHASSTSVSLRTTQRMAGNLANYLSARRSGIERVMALNTQSRQNQLLIADASSDPRMLAYVINENKKIEKMQQDKVDSKTSGFFRPLGVFYEHDSTSKMTGFRAKAVGAQFGLDKSFGPNLLMGISGGYSHSFINFKDGRGEGDVDSFRVGPYASYSKDNFFIDTSVSFGYHNNENKRDIRFGTINYTADSDYHAYDLSAYIGGGYDFPVNDWTVTPTTSLQYICYHTESFRETGAGAAGLDVDAATSHSLRGKLGVTLSTVTELHGTKIVPELFGGWAHEFIDDEDIKARFVQGTAKFTTDVDNGRDDSVYFGAGISALLKENISAFVRYEGEHSSGNDIKALNVGITVLF